MADKPTGRSTASNPLKAVDGPPEDKSLKDPPKPRANPCPNCGAPLAKYAGPQAHKQGREECAACGYHSTTE